MAGPETVRLARRNLAANGFEGVKVMRGAFVAIEAGCLEAYARRAFERYWGELADISQDHEVRAMAEAVGLDAGEFFTKITSARYKERLRECTQECVQRGGFGSPTMFLDGDDMYFGNDRVALTVVNRSSASRTGTGLIASPMAAAT